MAFLQSLVSESLVKLLVIIHKYPGPKRTKEELVPELKKFVTNN